MSFVLLSMASISVGDTASYVISCCDKVFRKFALLFFDVGSVGDMTSSDVSCDNYI